MDRYTTVAFKVCFETFMRKRDLNISNKTAPFESDVDLKVQGSKRSLLVMLHRLSEIGIRNLKVIRTRDKEIKPAH